MQERKAEPLKKKPAVETVEEKMSEVKDAVEEKVIAVQKKEKQENIDKKPAIGANDGGGKKKGESLPKQAAAEDVGEPQPSTID